MVDVYEFKEGYDQLRKSITNFADSSCWSTTLRIHYFYAPDSLTKVLTYTKLLLCADEKGRKSYNLTPEENLAVWGGTHYKKGSLEYLKSDIRLENKLFPLFELQHIESKDTIVIFTHEWALLPQTYRNIASSVVHLKPQVNYLNRRNLNLTIEWLVKNKYKFTFLE